MSVLFATNRALVPGALAFSSDPAPAGTLHWGIADVAGTEPPALTLDAVAAASPSPAMVDFLLGRSDAGDAEMLIVTVHGFDYSFEEAILRAAALGAWFGGATKPLCPKMIAFAWPSLGELGLVHYGLDYQRASGSAPSFCSFLRQLVPLIRQWRAIHPAGRVALLAHSMGNHVLHAGLEGDFSGTDGHVDLAAHADLFDLAILAAGDENDRAFEAPGGPPNGLRMLLTLCQRTLVLCNPHDAALIISRDVHLIDRIGHVGARDKMALRGHPICFVDCGAVDGFLEDPEGHQYYRCVPRVRDLIAQELLGSRDWQGKWASFRPPTNDWELERAPTDSTRADLPVAAAVEPEMQA